MGRGAVDSLGETVASLPPRPANLVAPPDLHPELIVALSREGVERLYSHQREACERVRAGENVVVATAMFIAQEVRDLPVRVTALASGLPVGGDLEYADEVTLGRAFAGRREL